jgi:hypothetical protein
MASLEHRIACLEAVSAEPGQGWTAVHLTLQRVQSRARLQMCAHLGIDATDPRVLDATACLTEDTPAQRAQDIETLARWRQQQGIPDDSPGARARLTARLETMARRIDHTRSHP